MINKSQITDTLTSGQQVLLLVGLFVVAGLVLPMFLAPYVFSVLPFSSHYGNGPASVSVQISRTQLSDGQSFVLRSASPAGGSRISRLSYACPDADITFVYHKEDTARPLPCDVEIRLPDSRRHRIQIKGRGVQPTAIPTRINVRANGLATTTAFSVVVSDKSEVPSKESETLHLRLNDQS